MEKPLSVDIVAQILAIIPQNPPNPQNMYNESLAQILPPNFFFSSGLDCLPTLAKDQPNHQTTPQFFYNNDAGPTLSLL